MNTARHPPCCREPEKSPGPLPVHLVDPLIRSFNNDQYVADTGDIVFYERQQTAKTA